MVEGTFGAPCSLVAVAAFEALRQFDGESSGASLQTVNFVNIVAEVTSTFLRTFQDELDKQQNSEMPSVSSDQPVENVGSADNEVHAVVTTAEMSHASTDSEPVRVSITAS